MNIFILENDIDRIKEFIKRFNEVKQLHNHYDIHLEIARSYKQAVKILTKSIKQNKRYDFMFLDHDLGDLVYEETYKKNTGTAFSSWLLSENKKTQTLNIIRLFNDTLRSHLIIHSYNVIGAHEIYNKCRQYILKTYYIQEIWKQENFHKYFKFEPSLTWQFCNEKTYHNYKSVIKDLN